MAGLRSRWTTPAEWMASRPREELVEQDPHVGLGQRAPVGEQVVQRAAADKVHDDHDDVVLGGPAGRGEHVGVPDPHGLLVDEAQQQPGVVPGQHLRGHPAAGAQVAGAPHRPHAADPDAVGQEVAAGHGPASTSGHGP